MQQFNDAGASVPAQSARIPAPERPLDVFFAPRSVAVIGATETHGSVGRSVMENLLRNYYRLPARQAATYAAFLVHSQRPVDPLLAGLRMFGK